MTAALGQLATALSADGAPKAAAIARFFAFLYALQRDGTRAVHSLLVTLFPGEPSHDADQA